MSLLKEIKRITGTVLGITGICGGIVGLLIATDYNKPIKGMGRIKGTIISEEFTPGEVIEGEGLFHSGRVVKDTRFDKYIMIVKNNNGTIFSYTNPNFTRYAKELDLAYNKGDKIEFLPYQNGTGRIADYKVISKQIK